MIMKLVARLNLEFQVQLPLKAMFQFPNIRGLADYLEVIIPALSCEREKFLEVEEMDSFQI